MLFIGLGFVLWSGSCELSIGGWGLKESMAGDFCNHGEDDSEESPLLKWCTLVYSKCNTGEGSVGNQIREYFISDIS